MNTLDALRDLGQTIVQRLIFAIVTLSILVIVKKIYFITHKKLKQDTSSLIFNEWLEKKTEYKNKITNFLMNLFLIIVFIQIMTNESYFGVLLISPTIIALTISNKELVSNLISGVILMLELYDDFYNQPIIFHEATVRFQIQIIKIGFYYTKCQSQKCEQTEQQREEMFIPNFKLTQSIIFTKMPKYTSILQND